MKLLMLFLFLIFTYCCLAQKKRTLVKCNQVRNELKSEFSLEAKGNMVDYRSGSKKMLEFTFFRRSQNIRIEMRKNDQVITTFSLDFKGRKVLRFEKTNLTECDYPRSTVSLISLTSLPRNDGAFVDEIFYLGLITTMSDFLPLDNFYEVGIDDVFKPYFESVYKKIIGDRVSETDSIFRGSNDRTFFYWQKHLFQPFGQKQVFGTIKNTFHEIQFNRSGLLIAKKLLWSRSGQKKYSLIDNLISCTGSILVSALQEKTSLRCRDMYYRTAKSYRFIPYVMEYQYCTSETCLHAKYWGGHL